MPLMENSLIVVVFTWGAIILEVLLSMGLLMAKKNRKILLIAGITFHLLIMIFHGLFSFYFAMAGALVLYLGNISSNYYSNGFWFKNKPVIQTIDN